MMLILTTEWFLDVGLVVLSGEHLQLPPTIKSKGKKPFVKILEVSPLERSIKVYHDRPLVSLARNYRCHVGTCHTASAVTSRIDGESPPRREESGRAEFYIDPGTRD